ncbi:ornithine carbamoyltransferase [candidate division KSB1 bacterium]|nr:ornithine carbamoyltransferase [candidate division KSB1 bacterium]
MKKDFLSIADLTTEDIDEIFDLTTELKTKLKNGEIYEPLKGKTLAMIFQKPSARTRISFEAGIFQLGGHAIYLAPADIGIGTREPVADIARVLSRYNDGIMARLYGHEDIEALAKFSSIPVINGLTDLTHPCQIMADAFTILEHRKTLKDIQVTFIGDGNNVANSWINFAARQPIKLNLACPEGYDPDPIVLKHARETAVNEITIYREPSDAAKGADILYTDVWASMGQEHEAAEREKALANYQINDALVAQAKPNVQVMHCLPAHRGLEITDSVIEGPHSIVFDEAENRMHVQKALMVKLM